MAKKARLTETSKHIWVYYHFIRNTVDEGVIRLAYEPAEKHLADLLTKGLGKDPHTNLALGIGI